MDLALGPAELEATAGGEPDYWDKGPTEDDGNLQEAERARRGRRRRAPRRH